LILLIKLVEAAGIEPDYPQSTNWLMAHDFRRTTSILHRFPAVDRVPWSPLLSPGVDPSRGDILETALENQSLKSKANIRMADCSWQAKPWQANNAWELPRFEPRAARVVPAGLPIYRRASGRALPMVIEHIRLSEKAKDRSFPLL